ncbi:MAG: hypothetical protein NTX65_15515 [Ignavibacteriales bacterium]|nr:hypothetical protein [Ignavibacteriales bacterium]
MKRIILSVLIIISIVSCNENFEPFGELKDKYVLNCIIQGDTTFQVASVTRTYTNNNYDPYSNEVDPNVSGALIRLWNGDSLVTFRDTTITRSNDSKYITPYHLYYTNKFKLVSNLLEIEAILPNGVRLTANTTIPNSIRFISVDKVVPPKTKTHIDFAWALGTVDNAYLTQMSIYYYKADDPKKTIHIAYVPVQYVNKNGRDYPIAPRPNNSNELKLDVETISKTMELISDGDPNKVNYVILGPILEVASFGKSLSTYFNSIAHANDAYTVNLSEVDNTNINNGVGIFGIYLRNYLPFDFTHAYIKSFGYTPGTADVEPPL